MRTAQGRAVRGGGAVSLALQGGGSFGAYTWGVLDALLEDGGLRIEGVTGASSGAINAVALAAGYAQGGPAGARAALERFWLGLGEAARARRRSWRRDGRAIAESLLARSSSRLLHELATRLAADFEIDIRSMDPLRSVLERSVDFEGLRRAPPFRVFVNATNCRTSELRVFSEREMSADVVCASACMPMFFESVEIDGEPYWDGGFLGNPALFPVIYGCTTRDLVLVESGELEAPAAPATANAILSRIVELASRAALVRELRMVDFVSEMVRKAGGALPARVREMRIHRIRPAAPIRSVEGAGVLRADPAYFRRLRDVGREAGGRWLEAGALGADALESAGGGSCTVR